MLQWVTMISNRSHHRWSQNVVKTKRWHSKHSHWYPYHILTSKEKKKWKLVMVTSSVRLSRKCTRTEAYHMILYKEISSMEGQLVYYSTSNMKSKPDGLEGILRTFSSLARWNIWRQLQSEWWNNRNGSLSLSMRNSRFTSIAVPLPK